MNSRSSTPGSTPIALSLAALCRVLFARDSHQRRELLAHCRRWDVAFRADEHQLVTIAKPIAGSNVDLVPNRMGFAFEAPRFDEARRAAKHGQSAQQEQDAVIGSD